MPLVLLASLMACAPAVDGGQGITFASQLESPRLNNLTLDLRGDPDFQMSSLPDEQLHYYRQLWESIEDPHQRSYLARLAQSDDLYEYGRLVYTHAASLLLTFRQTGDLRLLDRIDEITEMMRAQLDDSWRDVVRGDTEAGKDGYLNWVFRYDTGEHTGRDLHEIDEMRTHAFIAEVAWAFRLNEDLESPNGVNYGERANFWTDYLRNHFEAKWRERNDVPWPNFPFIERPYVHPTIAITKYNYYLHRLTGENEYLFEAKRLSDLLFQQFQMLETEAGPAFVWQRNIPQLGGTAEYLQPTSYVTYVIADLLSLHLEGFYGWSDPRLPHALSNTVSQFIIDNGSRDFARDIGGGQRRAGIRASNPGDWRRLTQSGFGIRTYSFLTAWDLSGTLEQVSKEVWDSLSSEQNFPFIPAGLFFNEVAGDEIRAELLAIDRTLEGSGDAEDSEAQEENELPANANRTDRN